MGRLDQIDLSKSLSRGEEQRGHENAWARLAQLRLTLGGQIGPKRIGPAVLVLLEGWDASGKGGAIKRLVAPIDPNSQFMKDWYTNPNPVDDDYITRERAESAEVPLHVWRGVLWARRIRPRDVAA